MSDNDNEKARLITVNPNAPERSFKLEIVYPQEPSRLVSYRTLFATDPSFHAQPEWRANGTMSIRPLESGMSCAHLSTVQFHGKTPTEDRLSHLLFLVSSVIREHSNLSLSISVSDDVLAKVPGLSDFILPSDVVPGLLNPVKVSEALMIATDLGFQVKVPIPPRLGQQIADGVRVGLKQPAVTSEYELVFVETDGDGQKAHMLILVGKTTSTLGHMLGFDMVWHDNSFDRFFKPNFKDPPNEFAEVGFAFWTGIPDEVVAQLLFSVLVALSTDNYFGTDPMTTAPFTWSDFALTQIQQLPESEKSLSDAKPFLKLLEVIDTRPDSCGVPRHYIRPEALSEAKEWMEQHQIVIRLQPEHQAEFDSET